MSPIVRYFGLPLLGVCLAFQANGQLFNLEFESYNTTNGLSQNEVFDIVQDSQGFLWFGTDEGLNRFDGHEFKIFRNQENNPHTIIGNSVQALEIDRRGTLWIGTTNGISRYYPETELIEQLPVDLEDKSKPQGTSVRTITEHRDGSIWITYLGSGIDVYFPDKNEFFHYSIDRSDEYKIKNDYIMSLQFMPNGDKLFGSRGGIFIIGADGIPLTDDAASKKYPWIADIDRSVTCFQLSANQQVLWVGSELKGFYKVDLTTGQVTNFNTSNSALKFNNNVPSLYEDSRGNLWVGGEAIYLFNQKEETMLPYNELGVQENPETKNPILSIFEDEENNIWFGTFRFGVLKYNPGNVQILHYHSRQGEGSIKNDQVLSFNEDLDGNIWIGTDGGGLFKLLPDLSGFVQAPGNDKFSSQAIKCIYRDSHGFFWMGTWDGGMIKYHPAKGTVDVFSPERRNFKSRHVWDIKEDSLGNFWIGTLREGLCYFNPRSNTYQYYENIPEDSTSLVNNDILSLYIDSQNTLWIGTSDGVSVLRAGSEKFLNIESEDFPLQNINVLSIHEDKKGKIWMGTNGGGIIIMNKNLEIERVINEQDGLLSSTICALQADDHDNIWVSTYNGLFKVNSKDLSVAEVPQFIGLQGKEFIPRANFKLPNGRLLFGGVNGFNFFHPDSLKFAPLHVKVVFTSLHVLSEEIKPDSLYNGKKILAKSITDTDEISLTYKDYSFTLTFSPMLFNWQNSMHYAYKLEDLDQDWQYTTSKNRTIHYTNLAPGNYKLIVKTSFDGKNWSSEEKTLAIIMTPPWWGTLWFKIVAFLWSASVLFMFYRVRVSFLTKRKKKLEELVKVRTAELEKSNQELWQKNAKIEMQNEEIQTLMEELAEQKNDIENKNDELSLINEELQTQRDNLEIKSSELEKARQHLKEINASLEQLIEVRTEKLNQTLRELETFLYRASHDLRGPISSMLGLLRVAELESYKANPDKSYYEFFRKTILQLERTLMKLMQKHTIQKSKVSNELITKTVLLEMIQAITKELVYFREQDFQIRINDNIRFENDKTMLGILLTNLLENAFFFSDRSENPNVVLEITQQNEAVTISVLDHGPGIKEDVRDKIFTMFFRGDERSTGNGLGLYLVKNALSKIRGRIHLDSKEGSYSKFTVKLEKEKR
ncbi:MAG: two-component regulator propeller domain-containing protein [Bacteroidota bacterium]